MLHVRSLELSGDEQDIGLLHHFHSTLAGLFKRGFVNIKKVHVKGKELTGVYLTTRGISFLNDFVATYLPETGDSRGEAAHAITDN